MNRSSTRNLPIRHACRGVTLIEMMMSLVIGLLIAFAATLIFDNNKHAYLVQQNTDELQENGRFALHLLREDIRMAGYWGLNYEPSEISGNITLDPTCAPTWATNVTQPFTATNNDNTLFSCIIPNEEHQDFTDIITVRRASGKAEATGNEIDSFALTPNGVYLYSSLNNESKIIQCTSDSCPAADHRVKEPDALYKFIANAYYIRPCSEGEDNCPTLMRKTIGLDDDGDPKVVEESLVDYVEDLQITFGLDQDGDKNVDQYYDSGIPIANVPNVMTVVVEILVRASRQEAGYTNNRSYQLGDRVHDVNDGYRRQVFRDAIFLRNWSGLNS